MSDEVLRLACALKNVIDATKMSLTAVLPRAFRRILISRRFYFT